MKNKIENNKILEKIYTRLDSELVEHNGQGEIDREKDLKRIIIILEVGAIKYKINSIEMKRYCESFKKFWETFL